MLLFPTLHTIAMPSSVPMETSKATNQILAAQLLKVIEAYLSINEEHKQGIEYGETLNIDTESYTYQTYSILCDSFTRDPKIATDWLEDVHSAVSTAGDVPYHVTCVVASLLVVQKEARCIELCLKILVSIAEKEVYQVCESYCY